MRSPRVLVALSLILALALPGAGMAAEEAARGAGPGAGAAAGPGDGGGQMVMAPVEGHVPDFKPYIFWAYGLACLLIFLFILWTLSQLRRVEEKLDHLARTQGERRVGEP